MLLWLIILVRISPGLSGAKGDLLPTIIEPSIIEPTIIEPSIIEPVIIEPEQSLSAIIEPENVQISRSGRQFLTRNAGAATMKHNPEELVSGKTTLFRLFCIL